MMSSLCSTGTVRGVKQSNCSLQMSPQNTSSCNLQTGITSHEELCELLGGINGQHSLCVVATNINYEPHNKFSSPVPQAASAIAYMHASKYVCTGNSTSILSLGIKLLLRTELACNSRLKGRP
jgi:hypothetical protein